MSVWMKKRTVATELRQLVKLLRLVPLNARNTARTTDEGRFVTTVLSPRAPAISFPATFSGGRVTVPTMILRFSDFHHVPGSTIEVGFADVWVRLVISATTVDTHAFSTSFPHEVTVDSITLDYVPADDPIIDNEPGKSYGQRCSYYIYLVKVVGGDIVDTYAQTFVEFGQSIFADPPG